MDCDFSHRRKRDADYHDITLTHDVDFHILSLESDADTLTIFLACDADTVSWHCVWGVQELQNVWVFGDSTPDDTGIMTSLQLTMLTSCHLFGLRCCDAADTIVIFLARDREMHNADTIVIS